jgi:DNA-binding NarL/FixJ family response regulator
VSPEASVSAVRVVIADDHPVFREGLQTVLADSPGLEVLAAVPDGAAAVAAATSLRPDVVLMDLQMPGVGGVEATARIATGVPGVAVVVLTMTEDADTVFAALRAGARGYLLKEADAAEIARAVRAVAAGEAVFGPRVADQVLRFFASAGTVAATPFPQLTAREREVLALVAQGCDNAAIARRLFLSGKTVRNHVSACLAKLQVATRAEAVALARDAGLGAR